MSSDVDKVRGPVPDPTRALKTRSPQTSCSKLTLILQKKATENQNEQKQGLDMNALLKDVGKQKGLLKSVEK